MIKMSHIYQIRLERSASLSLRRSQISDTSAFKYESQILIYF